jgi:signal transduction histidine kinase
MTAYTSPRAQDPSPPFGPFAGPSLGLLYLDVRGRQLYLLNEAARQMHNHGVPILDSDPTLIHLRTQAGERVAAADLPLAAAVRGQPVEVHFVLSRPGQPDWHLLWTAAPLRDLAGEVTGVLAAVCGTLPPPDWHALAGLIHDLRTPLQTLRLLSAALGSGGLAGPPPVNDLGRLQAASERALQVGADLLEWCRAPVAGGRRVEAAWFALEPSLAALVQEHLGSAQRKGVALTADLAAIHGWEACTDRVRLGRILANLLSNAIRYTTSGGQVTLGAAWQGTGEERALALEVSDTGSGISPEEQESIFQPYQRGSAGQGDSSGGSGIGLSVVERLVAELGLRHEWASECGRGSDFRILLPRRMLRCNSCETQE